MTLSFHNMACKANICRELKLDGSFFQIKSRAFAGVRSKESTLFISQNLLIHRYALLFAEDLEISVVPIYQPEQGIKNTIIPNGRRGRNFLIMETSQGAIKLSVPGATIQIKAKS